jgi:hypothetical protein
LFELAFDQPPTFDPVIASVLAATAQQTADLQANSDPSTPAAVAPYLGRYTNAALGDVDIKPDAGTLISTPASSGPCYGHCARRGHGPDLPDQRLAASRRDNRDVHGGDSAPVMTFVDPTTGEGTPSPPRPRPRAPPPPPTRSPPTRRNAPLPRARSRTCRDRRHARRGAASPAAPIVASPSPFAVPPGEPADAETAGRRRRHPPRSSPAPMPATTSASTPLFTTTSSATSSPAPPLTSEGRGLPVRTAPAPPRGAAADHRRRRRRPEARRRPRRRPDRPRRTGRPRTEEPDYAILEEVDGRWLVDEIHEDAAPAPPPRPPPRA